MKRLLLTTLAVFSASSVQAAGPISALTWDGLAGSPSLAYVSSYGVDAGADINFYPRGTRIASIIYNDVEWQAFVYWNDTNNLVVAVRHNRGGWKKYTQRLITVTDAADAHYTCSCGFDQDGYLHIVYSMHDSALKYRKSSAEIESFDGAFGAETSMLGTNEAMVSYPAFFNDPAGRLYYKHRDNSGGGGEKVFMYLYDETTGWEAIPGTTAGEVFVGGYSSDWPYSAFPVFSSDFDGAGTGRMMYVITLRDGLGGDYYTKMVLFWNGSTWEKSDGSAQTIPANKNNTDVIVPLPVGSGMAGSDAYGFDELGRPHVVYHADPDSTTTRSWHIYHNGTSWSTAVEIYDSVQPAYGGCLLFKADHTALCFYIDADDDKLKYLASGANSYGTWTETTLYDTATSAEATSLGIGFDRGAYERDGRLDCMIPAAASSKGLSDGLVCFLRLEEASGTRYDSQSSLTFADNNTVGSTTGKHGTCADFIAANSEFLQETDTAPIDQTGDLTVAYWVWTDIQDANNRAHWGKYLPSTTSRQFGAYYSSASQKFVWHVSADGTSNTTLLSDSFTVPPPTGEWLFVVQSHNTTTDVIRLRCGSGTTLADANETAHSTGIFNGGADLNIGRDLSTTATGHHDGRIDSWGMWNRQLTPTEEASLFNAGGGRDYYDLDILPPTIHSHADPETVVVDVGVTSIALIEAYGDLAMSVGLSGTHAALMNIVDNNNGTFALSFNDPPTGGNYDVTVTITNAAGTDSVDLTVGVPEPAADSRDYDAFGGGTIP